MTEETPQYHYSTEQWDQIQDALSMAMCIGILSSCTCDDPLLKWRAAKCGHCQLEEALAGLAELRKLFETLRKSLSDVLEHGCEGDVDTSDFYLLGEVE